MTVLLGATVRRFGIQSRRPRALPFDLVDCPPCTLVDRIRKRQLRGRRHYIYGSLSLPRSGLRVRAAMGPISAGVRQLPYLVVMVALILSITVLRACQKRYCLIRMRASRHDARQVALGGPKEPSHEFSTSLNVHAHGRCKPEGRSPLFEDVFSYCWRLLATNRWFLLRGLSGSVRTSSPPSARGFRYACAT